MGTKDKTRITGYHIVSGEICFTNYLNKTIKRIEVRNVVDRWREEIEEMAKPSY